MAKILMKGNEAFGRAAIEAGCHYFFGYPITPQSELPEYLSRELPKVGGAFVQAESEVAAINMGLWCRRIWCQSYDIFIISRGCIKTRRNYLLCRC